MGGRRTSHGKEEENPARGQDREKLELLRLSLRAQEVLENFAAPRALWPLYRARGMGFCRTIWRREFALVRAHVAFAYRPL